MRNEPQSERTCRTCGATYTGSSYMTQCRGCYWHLKGFSWQCAHNKVRHTPDELKMLTHGAPVGLGMWGEGQKLIEIVALGGFEQHSYEAWDEMWKVKVFVSKGDGKSLDVPAEWSGSCLLCALQEALKKSSCPQPGSALS